MNINIPDAPGHYGVIVYADKPVAGEPAELTMAREMMRATIENRQLQVDKAELATKNSQLTEDMSALQQLYQAALAEIERLNAQPPVVAPPAPVPPVVVHPGGVPSFKYINGKLSGMAAPYIVHYGEHEKDKTISDKKRAVDFIARMGKWNGVILSVYQTEDDTLPRYIQSKKLDWWINYINGPWKELPYEEYKGYIARMFAWGGVGAVIDDAQNFSADQMAAMVAPVPNGKPIIASYSAGFDVTAHLAKLPRLLIARQLFRHGETEPDEPKAAGTHVTNQLKNITHVATDEAYRKGDSLVNSAQITAMFDACQSAGIQNHAPYAAWNSNNWNWEVEPEPAKTLNICMGKFWAARLP